jgi:glucose/arabinose dehydrogenase
LGVGSWALGPPQALLAASLALCLLPLSPANADDPPPIQLPAGFSIETICDGIDGAITMDLARDGRIFICEQMGALRIVKDGKLLPEPFLRLPVDDYWERGLIGVALHPKFPAEPCVYIHYVAPKPYPHHVISRFTADGDRAREGSEKMFVEGENQDLHVGNYRGAHQGGAIRFGSDGKLYVPIGEHTARDPAQSLELISGKILRFNDDGSIPTDNPFYAQTTGIYRAIYARGLRNPYGLAVQPGTGRMFINDVGQELFEEIDEVAPGANYGWPIAEGPANNRPEFTKPIHFYGRKEGICISGGVFYNPDKPQFPAEFVGKYFFADFNTQWIRTLDPAHPEKAEPFAQRVPGATDLAVTPDGALLVLVRNTFVHDDKFRAKSGSLLRVRYTAP